MTDDRGFRDGKAICPLPHPTHPDRDSYRREPALLCFGHIRKIRSNLADIPTLHSVLLNSHISWEQRMGYHAPSADEALIINAKISAYRAEMIERIASWVRIVAGARSINMPQYETALLTPDTSILQGLCSWLLIHVDWAASNPDYAEDLSEVTSEVKDRAWNLAYPNQQQEIKCGDCINIVDGQQCSGTLIAVMRPKDDLFPKYIACSSCDKTVESKDWYRYGLEIEAHKAAAA